MKMLISLFAVFLLFFDGTQPGAFKKICLSDEEMKLYELIMAYRTANGLATIPLSAKLTSVAQVHARDLQENHDPDDKVCNLHSWSNMGEWKGCCYTSDHKEAECMWNKPHEITGYVGAGYEISYYSEAGAKAEEGIGGWKRSTAHNEVMINLGIWKDVTFQAIGIGIYKNYGVVWFGEVLDSDTVGKCK